VFEASITTFLAASGVAGLVLGFALRSMIADFFSGTALNLERSFSLGDHIKLDTGVDGEVVEINWRTTVLKTAQLLQRMRRFFGVLRGSVAAQYQP
jgi:small-conductance mechanosensitive channel